MNPFILLFADGTMFFVGMLLTVAAVCLARWLNEQGWPRVWSIGSLVGILLVIVSSMPWRLWGFGLWLALCLSALILSARSPIDTAGQNVARLHRTFQVCFVGLSILVCLLELPYRCKPNIAVSPDTAIYIVGDSISAGIETAERTWPGVLADSSGLTVVNLARPGATAKTAFAQTQRIPADPSLVIVEIGGNDLLGGTQTAAFRDALDALLAELHSHGHRIVMFELPLPPFHGAFGRVQREAARRYGVTLIPKRCLTAALGTKGGTLDGLHLSQIGHDRLAADVRRLLKPAD